MDLKKDLPKISGFERMAESFETDESKVSCPYNPGTPSEPEVRQSLPGVPGSVEQLLDRAEEPNELLSLELKSDPLLTYNHQFEF